MHKNSWVKDVHNLCISHGQVGGLYTLSTALALWRRFVVFVVRNLDTIFTRRGFVFTQNNAANFSLVGGWFYSFSTMPNKATNELFKGLVT